MYHFIGNGYDESHGNFKAPVSGLYIISASIASPPNQHCRIEIVRNGIQLAAMVGLLRDISNQTVVVSLNENDQVWVRNWEPTIMTTVDSYSDRYFSTFSVALIAGS